VREEKHGEGSRSFKGWKETIKPYFNKVYELATHFYTFSSNENLVLMNERFYCSLVHGFILPEAFSEIAGT
jgi:hypothetical protein